MTSKIKPIIWDLQQIKGQLQTPGGIIRIFKGNGITEDIRRSTAEGRGIIERHESLREIPVREKQSRGGAKKKPVDKLKKPMKPLYVSDELATKWGGREQLQEVLYKFVERHP